MATNYGTAPIVTEGLTFTIDAANKKSYPGSGTTWFDIVGSSNVTLTNGPTFSADNAGIISFDGSNDIVTVPNQLLFPDTQNLTVEYFINILAANGNQIYGMLSNSNRLYHGIYNNYWDVGYGGTSWDTSSNTNKQILVDGWNHVTVTVTSGTAKIYINAVANARTITDNSVSYQSGDLYGIGGYMNPSYNNNYSGVNKLSYLRVYNRGLTAAEVTQNYNALKGRFE
tara:strand:- start:283 stop:963 length:681 start_codon:yes stop_codon:yes gene_type:complete